jgi:putative nucleotidyltransferase with HDIG domain
MLPKELIQRACDIPAVPMVAFKVLRLVEDPHSTLEDLQRVITADQAMATRILKIANSAFYGARRNIDTVSEAIIIIGFNTVKYVVLAASTREVYKGFGIIEQKLWEHSLAVSIASGLIAGEVAFLKREEAAVAGLLHDVGKAILNNNQPEKFSIVTQMVYEKRKPYASVEEEIIGFDHAEVGFLLAEKWGFPEVLCNVIRKHHTWSSGDPFGGDPYESSLCLAIALADALCVRLGVGYRNPMADLDLGEEILREKLGIDKKRFYEIITIFKDLYLKEKIAYL